MTLYRFIPSWLFRFTVLDVLELDTDRIRSMSYGRQGLLGQMTTTESRQLLRDLTMAGAIDCSRDNPLGFGLMDEASQHLIGGVWIGEREHYEPAFGFSFLLPNGAGWLFAALLSKEHRGKGAYNDLLVYAVQKAIEQGKRRIFLAVSPVDKASVHAHGKFCSSKVGRVLVVKLLDVAWVRAFGALETGRSLTTRCKSMPNLVKLIPPCHSTNRKCGTQRQELDELVTS